LRWSGRVEVAQATMSEPRRDAIMPRLLEWHRMANVLQAGAISCRINGQTSNRNSLSAGAKSRTNRRYNVTLTPYATDHDRRSDRHEGDEDVRPPSSPRDFRAELPRGHIRVHVHGSDRVRRSGARVCTGRDWLVTLQLYVHRRGRHACGANARREGSQCGRRGGLRYDRSLFRGRVDGCYALGLRRPS
jgi:hypothetical protein